MKQECIPVGCVPVRTFTVSREWGYLQWSWGGGVSAPEGGVPAWSRGGVCIGGVYKQAWSSRWGGLSARGGVYLPGPRGVYLPGPGGCLLWGGCTCLVPGGVSAPGGYPPGPGGGVPGQVLPPPVNRILDTRLWKYYLGQNFVSAGNKGKIPCSTIQQPKLATIICPQTMRLHDIQKLAASKSVFVIPQTHVHTMAVSLTAPQ